MKTAELVENLYSFYTDQISKVLNFILFMYIIL